MEKLDYLIDFMEGDLNQEQEQQLFYDLSVDEELRGKMKQLMAMDNAVQSNPDFFAPSPESTGKVFTALGFAVPGGAVPPSKSLAVKLKELLNKYSQALTGAGVTAFLLLILYYFTLDNVSPAKETISSNYDRVISFSESENIPIVSSVESSTKDNSIGNGILANKENNTSKKSLNNYTMLPDNNDYESNQNSLSKESDNLAYSNKNNSSENNTKNIEKEKSSYLFRSPFVENPQDIVNSYNNYNAFPVKMNLGQIIPFDINVPGKFSMEIRGSQNWTMQEETIFPNEYALFNNYAGSIFYSLSDNFDIGLDVRQETYMQQFSNELVDGGILTYEQNPNFTTFTAAARYKMFEVYDFSPFIQGNLGFNRGGFVSRGMIGTEYQLYDRLGFTFGVELSNMTYSYSQQSYNTNKIGFLYGLRYKF